MPKRVFISYKREDVDFATRLREFLINEGYETWMDIYNIPKGVDPENRGIGWDDAVFSGLKESDIVIGVMTISAMESPNVLDEWGWALSNKLPFILLRLEEISERQIHPRFGRVNYINMASAEEPGFGELIQALKNPRKHVYLETQDERNRRIMLNKVQSIWIEGVLQKSLHGFTKIELGMVDTPGMVNHPWDLILDLDEERKKVLPGTKLTEVLVSMQNALLILGAPGSGKTVTLLELAQEAIQNAKMDYSLPIPVLFNLSSWADKKQQLPDWLITELNKKYQIPRKLATRWVEEDSLMLLLDGLDELPEDLQEKCVEKINQFRDEHGLVPIVVCCREKEYQKIKTQLVVSGAITIQPLNKDQIVDFLSQGGEKLDGLRAMIEEDQEFSELANSPLMLNIMSLAYQEYSQKELETIKANNPQSLKKEIFNAYIKRMFKRIARTKKKIFNKRDTLHWLSWIAKQMKTRNQSVFYLENLQPSMLESKKREKLYSFLRTLFFGIFFGITGGIAAIVYKLIFFQLAGTFFGIVAFLYYGLIFGLFYGLGGVFGSRIILSILGSLIILISPGLFPTIGNLISDSSVLPDIIFILLFLLSPLLIFKLSRYLGKRLVPGIVGVFVGIPFGIFGMISFLGIFSLLGHRISKTIKTVDKINVSLKFLKYFLIAGAILILYFIISFYNAQPFERGTQATGYLVITAISIIFILIFSPLLGIIAGMFGQQQITVRIKPNQGIVESGRNGVKILLFGFLTGFLIFGFTGLLSLDGSFRFVERGLSGGILLGSVGGMVYGGHAYLSHQLLRKMLFQYGYTPKPNKYIIFLDSAVDLIFLNKVGGGYMFIHRMLLDHFSEIDVDELFPPENEPSVI